MADFPEILAVAAIVHTGDGRILLRRRLKEPDEGKWQLFAGFVHPGERLAKAVRRVLREKGGIEQIGSITFTGRYYDEPGRHPGTYCIPFVFSAVVSEDAVTTSDNIRWFSRKEIATLELALDDSTILKDFLAA